MSSQKEGKKEYKDNSTSSAFPTERTGTASNTQSADYPPIPKWNHISQLEDETFPFPQITLCDKYKMKNEIDFSICLKAKKKWIKKTPVKSEYLVKTVIPFKVICELHEIFI